MNTSAVNISATVIRYDLLPELTDLLVRYTGKREEIETFLASTPTPNDADPFAEHGPDSFHINGIAVSGEAVQIGLRAELTAMETKLENRFNIIVGRPLPKPVACPEVIQDIEEHLSADSTSDAP